MRAESNIYRDYFKVAAIEAIPALVILTVLWQAIALIEPTLHAMTDLSGNPWAGAVLGALLWYGTISLMYYGVSRVASFVDHDIINHYPEEELTYDGVWSCIGRVFIVFGLFGIVWALIPVVSAPFTVLLEPSNIDNLLKATGMFLQGGALFLIFCFLSGLFLIKLDTQFNSPRDHTPAFSLGPFPCCRPNLRGIWQTLSHFVKYRLLRVARK